ncbi:MAG: hypothetical protein JWQ81_3072 [Amycolatopsis sp.]|nr:hypothetical protein [Amycolatopsis sp.]
MLRNVLTDDARFVAQITAGPAVGPDESGDAIVKFVSDTTAVEHGQRRHVLTNVWREGEEVAHAGVGLFEHALRASADVLEGWFLSSGTGCPTSLAWAPAVHISDDWWGACCAATHTATSDAHQASKTVHAASTAPVDGAGVSTRVHCSSNCQTVGMAMSDPATVSVTNTTSAARYRANRRAGLTEGPQGESRWRRCRRWRPARIRVAWRLRSAGA